jgi:hypothetical protein
LLPSPFGFRLHGWSGSPPFGRINALARYLFASSLACPRAASTSHREFSLPPDQRVLPRSNRLARPPDRPDFLSLPAPGSIARYRQRITVPGPLPFRWLAVPQTSWNLLHYALEPENGQSVSVTRFTLFLNFFVTYFEVLSEKKAAFFVKKTAAPVNVS